MERKIAALTDELFMRNFLDTVPKHLQAELYGKVQPIVDAPELWT